MTGSEHAKPLRAGDPQELGHYTVIGRLGRGGMGTVYLAESPQGRSVAIKLIHPDLSDDPDFRRRFAREVSAARSVARFSTAAVLDAQLDGDPLYIVSEYVSGPNLAEAIQAEGPMAGGTLESLAVGVGAALAAIHGAGVVHRDLKPANVLLSTVGPKVIDFGIARALDDGGGATRSSQLMGTPAYLAPELIEGHPVTPASDIFSWGCLVAYAGTGRAPFEAPSIPAVLHQITTQDPDLDGLDARLAGLVTQALAKDPQQRPGAQQILNQLVGHEEPSSAEIDRTVSTSWSPPAVVTGEVATPSESPEPDGEAAHPATRPYDAAGTPGALPTSPPTGDPHAGPPPGAPSGPQPPMPPQAHAAGPHAGYPGHVPPAGPYPPASPGTPNGPPGGPPPGAVAGAAPTGGRQPRSSQRALLLAGGGVLALLVLAVTIVVVTRPPGPPDGRLLYTENFSNPDADGAWDGGSAFTLDETRGYDDGHFVLRAHEERESSGEYAPYDDPHPDRMLVSVDTVVHSGPGHGQYGVRCFRQDDVVDNTYYEAVVDIDGGGAELRRHVGEDEFLESGVQVSSGQLASTDSVSGYESPDPDTAGTDDEVVNTLTLSCELDPERDTMTLRLWVNDTFVLEGQDDEDTLLPVDAEDGRETALSVWRTAGSGDDVIVYFTDFELHELDDA
ncbi:serine/threonine-protein kinase [Lipingzhangella sp. LS1_29]|uniref:Serine/threonine-protein kinase n=1 Tax=Lipingzhangella rawalii TaxID=2055835 RepID=A0ABU2H8A2_9ACTN|nr:serine/threonine-protein kinase [Lipingzhangella rawalii]MDS1271070.1 serine/threonine-protein kinase [Lipingzhangella rawalii]